MENLESLVMLEQLYLSDNGIETIEGLDTLVSPFTYTVRRKEGGNLFLSVTSSKVNGFQFSFHC